MNLNAYLLGGDAEITRDRALQVLLLANICGPFASALVSPILDPLSGVYGVSTTRVGLLMAAYTSPAIFLIPIFGAVSDRYGRKPVLVGGLLLFGVSGSLMAVTTDFQLALLFRIFQGIGGAGVVPIVVTSLGDIYRGTSEATAQGLRFTTSGASQALSPALAGFLVLFAWQIPILIQGIAIPVAVVVFLWLEEPSSNDDDASPDAAAADGSGVIAPLAASLRQPSVLATLIGYGIPSFLFFAFLTYASAIVIQVNGGTATEAGIIVALGSAVFAISAAQTGRVLGFFDDQLVPFVVTTLVTGSGLFGVAFGPNLSAVAGSAIVLGAGYGVLQSMYRSAISSIAPLELRGTLVSIAESLLRVGATMAPVALGAAIELTRSNLGFDLAVQYTLAGGALVGTAVALGSSFVFSEAL